MGPSTGDPSIAIAASRAGALGLLNLEFERDAERARQVLAHLSNHARHEFGALIDVAASGIRSTVLDPALPGLSWVALAAPPGSPVDERAFVLAAHAAGRSAVRTITSLEQALDAQQAGFDGLIAKGHESGGWVSSETAFVLTQRLAGRVDIPFWVQGGIGEHTAAACICGAAAGVVLDNQLLLAREAQSNETERRAIERFDGSETRVVGPAPDCMFRAYAPLEARARLAEALATDDELPPTAWRERVRTAVARRDAGIWPLGQDAAFAADLAQRHVTVGGIVRAVEAAIRADIEAAQRLRPLAEGAGLAQVHGTRYPIVQGPMTRVSDVAPFASDVAAAGGLPFLALALMRRPEVESLLTEAKSRMAGRPWGVGILGFVPPDLRAEQLEVVRAHGPPFALIAGGRADQALDLEREGIATYLHVPSPRLLELFLEDGARRFVFEGLECGGHIGPRTSFVLWESMIGVLLEHLQREPTAKVSVLFAGGIHDAPSAAMVSVIAAPLAERGASVGILCGTAYLYTHEAVSSGAIKPSFQRAALAAESTAVLESAPGLSTRCLVSPFVETFAHEKRRLDRSGASGEEQRQQLELLNIGRLRIATKGLERRGEVARDRPRLLEVAEVERWQRGLFMLGQIGALHDQTCSISDLHEELSAGSTRLLDNLAPAARSVPATVETPPPPPAAVAIVGMASIVPGAPNLDTFWANIMNNVDAVREVPDTRWDVARYFDPDRSAPDGIYSRWGGFIDEVPFDPLEFGMPPSSVPSIEPFQLLSLLVVRDALRDAGYATRPFDRAATSVILGAGGGGGDLANGYVVRSSLPGLLGDQAPEAMAALRDALPEWTEDSFPGLLMNVAAGRVANRFDLGGVNYTVDAACASSLAAIYLAVRELENGTSSMVIAGGIDAIQSPFGFLTFSRTQALSPTGRSRPFDASADGIAISEGFAALILKRVADAERDGDRIYAVIRGVGGSSDGRARGLTAPEPAGQVRALERAYAHARVSPATVELIEAHGTGTVVGDRAELESLGRVFAGAGAAAQSTAVGSVKSVIGHTKATAGICGVVKTAKALHHKVLPPTLGVAEPNPALDGDSPLFVNTMARPWVGRADRGPRRAGVSAFGFGGTNFHVALEEYQGDYLPGNATTLGIWPAELFAWRAESRAALAAAVREDLAWLRSHPSARLAALAHDHASRAAGAPGDALLAVVASSIEDLATRLERAAELIDGETAHHGRGLHFSSRPLAATGELAYVLPGQGSQYVNMLRELAIGFPEVRQAFEAADAALVGKLAAPLSRYVFPPPAFSDEVAAKHTAALTETRVAQPALGAAELGLVRLLARLGVQPDMAAGHSYGEIVALCVAGALSEHELLRLSEARGRLMSAPAGADGGAMAAVLADGETTRSLLDGSDLWVANVNAPRQTVVAGTTAAIEALVARCDERGVPARRLSVSRAFHSPLVASAEQEFAHVLAATDFGRPTIGVFSNTTGARYPADPDAMRDLLGRQLTSAVNFQAEIEAMHEAGARVFLEVGPGRAMSGLVRDTLADRPHATFSIDAPSQPGMAGLLDALAGLYSEGVAIDLLTLFEGRNAIVDDTPETLSATTWMVDGGSARPVQSGPRQARQPVPIATPAAAGQASGGTHRRGSPATDQAPLMDRFQDVMNHFLDVQQSVMGAAHAAAREAQLQSADEVPSTAEHGPARIGRHMLRWQAVSKAEIDPILSPGALACIVGGGEAGARLADALRTHGLRVEQPEDSDGIAALRQAGAGPISALVYLAALDDQEPALDSGAESFLELIKALGDDLSMSGRAHGSALFGATLLDLATGGSDEDPGHAWLPGFFKSLALEWPDVVVRSIDLPKGKPELQVDCLLAELLSRGGPLEVAYDAHGLRLAPALLPADLSDAGNRLDLDGDSVIVATGGARGVTAEACVGLARSARCKFVLLGRTPQPGRQEAAETAGIDTEADLKAALRDLIARDGAGPTPVEIERRYRKLIAERAVRSTLARLRAAGSQAEYVVCDVSDMGPFARALSEIYDRYGRIDGVIHGAGVLHDRLLENLTGEQLASVMAPKLKGAATLAATLRPEALRFLVFFSSITARAGNRGQVAYGAANEALNRLAGVLARRWQRRVVAINWGPWDEVGMASQEVRHQFARNGVALIPTDEGVALFLDELRRGQISETEVVIAGATAGPREFVPIEIVTDATPAGPRLDGRGLNGPMLHGRAERREEGDHDTTVDLTLSRDHDLYLRDHVIQGRPVLPFSVAVELMAEAAALAAPGLPLAEIRDVQLLRGITLDEDESRLLIGVSSSLSSGTDDDDRRELLLDATIEPSTDGPASNARAHYRAALVFGGRERQDRLDEAAPEQELDSAGSGPPAISAGDAYREHLFHGPSLQVIESIVALGPGGGRAYLRSSSPADVLAGQPPGSWLLDPVALDAALQLQLVWGRLNWDLTVLPSRARRVVLPAGHARRWRSGELLRCDFRVRAETHRPLLVTDFALYGDDGRPIVRVEGFEGLGIQHPNDASDEIARVATKGGANQ